jgi:hypothetical protein
MTTNLAHVLVYSELVTCVKGGGKGRILVEDRNTAERTGRPFCVVFGEVRPDGVEEWPNEGRLP